MSHIVYPAHFLRLSSICLGFLIMFSLQQAHAQKISSDDLLKQALYETNVQHHYEKAIALCKQGLALSPDYLDIRLLLGRLYMLTHQYDLARIELSRVLAKQPNNADALTYLINLEMQDKRYDEALCYANMALYYYPDSVFFILKKTAALSAGSKFDEAMQVLQQSMKKLPNQAQLHIAYLDQLVTAARSYQDQHNYIQAHAYLQQALQIDPGNKLILTYLINLEAAYEHYDEALIYANQALQHYPDDPEFIRRKIGILISAKRYLEAEDFLQQLTRKDPRNAEWRKLATYVHLQAARDYAHLMPQYQYNAVLVNDPTNREALQALINLYSAQNAYPEALIYANQALQYYPDDTLFLLKKIALLDAMGKYAEAYPLTARLAAQYPGHRELKVHLLDELMMAGRAFEQDQQWDSAASYYQQMLDVDSSYLPAYDRMIALSLEQKQYNLALAYVRKALQLSTNPEPYQFREAGILEAAGRYQEAAAITRQLMTAHPQNLRYRQAYLDQLLEAARADMQAQQPGQAVEDLQMLLTLDPPRAEALDLMINALYQMKQYGAGLAWCDTALQYYPQDKDFLVKKAGLLEASGQYAEAARLLANLFTRYPYDTKLQNSLSENLFLAGKQFAANNQTDSASSYFWAAIRQQPSDTLAWISLINLKASLQQTDSALWIADSALHYIPHVPELLMKKASFQLAAGKSKDALQTLDSLLETDPHNLAAKALRDQIRIASYHQAIGIDYNFTSFGDRTTPPWNLASLYYQRLPHWGSYDLRLNFANRNNRNGLQGEAEVYWNHDSSNISYVDLAFAHDSLFPRLRAAYTFTHYFRKGWQADIGGRYLNFDSSALGSAYLGLGKYFSDYWLYAQAYLTPQNKQLFGAYRATLRYYYSEQRDDYLNLIVGTGISPDDRSRYFGLNKWLSLSATNVAIGYQHIFRGQTIAGLTLSWTNQEIAQGIRQNEYDVYVHLVQKF
ncbi:tetratricopeptide repeat protein [Thermoflavifilum thermophilum]|uniref:Outer membrane protein, YaiO family n=1 Tax=Thermoflavifilum thermophilum TaxID=1393122 RepID=A0A1I7ND49_9BACT|nr:tetratricopeptide repeat protein [Thermoflavifilum thermophilum]SFV32608.1 outer membrane protein, YaiO family [Thermoflavifilum thermophilum]